MKNLNFISLPIYIFSILLGISSNSWMLMWMSLEINLLSFIFMMSHLSSILYMESMMKYYLIQALSSLLLLTAMTANNFFSNFFLIYSITPLMAMMLKSGMAPLHTWVPNVISNFPWMNFLLFLTMQKIVPLLIIFSSWFNLTWIIIFVNLIVGSTGGLIQSSFKKMMIFSSINNISWMMMSMISFYTFFLFMSNYFFMNMVLIYFLKKNNLNWLIQIKSMNFYNKILIFSLFMSLSGLPPFLGFVPKWMIIKKMQMMLPMLTMFSLMLSVLMLYFYMKTTILVLLNSMNTQKWKISIMNNTFYKFFIANLMGPAWFYLLT